MTAPDLTTPPTRGDVLRIGTRGSPLALWQANAVAERLAPLGMRTDIIIIRTSGDRMGEVPLSEAGGKRLFVKEIEDALLDRRVDVAVHSAKDMPVVMPDGLEIGAVLPREEPWDAIVLPASRTRREEATVSEVLAALGDAPRIGTSSVRRVTQLHRLMPTATFDAIRGNLETRLRKLDEGRYDALVLAAAGLKRLGVASRISARLPLVVSVPAPGQGAIAVQVRTETDAGPYPWLEVLDDRRTRAAVTAERIVVEALGGGCQTPIGALAVPADPDGLELHALVTSIDGSRALRAMAFGSLADPEALGQRVARQLLAEGAAEILQASAVEHGDA